MNRRRHKIKWISKKLTSEQKERNIIFSSCLSCHETEQETDVVHEIKKDDDDADEQRERLLDVSFFRHSHFLFHIIRE